MEKSVNVKFRSEKNLENREYLGFSGKRLLDLASNRDFRDFWLNDKHSEAPPIHGLVANTG